MNGFLISLAAAALVGLALATALGALLGRYGFPLPPARARIGCIDGLRGYLALAVMVHHFFIWSAVTRFGADWGPPSLNVLNQLGAGGVALFFMITGAVFYPRILAGFAATSWTSVYLGRAFRLLPLIAVSVAVVVAVIVARMPHPVVDARLFGAAARWLTAWGEPPLLGFPDSGRINAYVLWSLRLEWLFYLLALPACAAAMALLHARRLPTVALPLALLGLLGAARIGAGVAGLDIGILKYFTLFAVGMLAFECQARPRLRAMLAQPRVGWLAAAGLLLGVVATPVPFDWSLPLFGCFFACVICGNDLGGVLRGRGALVLGECSFGIYLLHGIALYLLFDGGATAHIATGLLPVLLPAAMVVVVAVTAATYLLVERPAIRLGKTVTRRLVHRPSSDREPLAAP